MSELVVQYKDDVAVVQFNTSKILSEFLIAQIARELMELADELADDSDAKMLLNFQGVTFMSSAMLGKIVLLKEKCKANKTTIKLCNISPVLMVAFKITKLNKGVYESEEEALTALQKKGWFG